MKKIFLISMTFALGFFLVGCSDATPIEADKVIEADQQANEERNENAAKFDQYFVGELDTDAMVDATDGDFCEIYLETMQCFVDTYPEEYGKQSNDYMAELRGSIYDQDMGDEERQSYCKFMFIMTQNTASGSDEYVPGENDCGILSTNVGEMTEEELYFDE